MSDAEWLRVFIEILSMVVIASGFVWAIRSDTKVLGVRLGTIDKRLDRMDVTMANLSEAKARMDVIDERLLAQGRRVDEISVRFNDWVKGIYEDRHKVLQTRVNNLERPK